MPLKIKVCTLTYLLHDNGYELYFNRDEQLSRSIAIPPQFNHLIKAIYPVDPQGGGTWLAVNQQGLSLALLNNYQVSTSETKNSLSRGKLILLLLQHKGCLIKQLETMELKFYRPFQLCIFPADLSIQNNNIGCVKWDGKNLKKHNHDLPITSSSVDYFNVKKIRQLKFNQLVDSKIITSEHLRRFHYSTEKTGKYSVNMQRNDAKTVSISHITVNQQVSYHYFDQHHNKNCTVTKSKNNHH